MNRQDNLSRNYKRNISCLKSNSEIQISPVINRISNIYENEDYPKFIEYIVETELNEAFIAENRLIISENETFLNSLEVKNGDTVKIELPDLSEIYGAFFINVKVKKNGETVTEQNIPFSHLRVGDGSFKKSGTCVHLFHHDSPDTSDCIKLIKKCGIKSIRDDFLWHELETEKGKVEVRADYQNVIRQFLDAGIEINALLLYGNQFYCDGTFGCPPKTEEALAAYVNYCKEIVKFYKGKIKRYEIWNEYNLGWVRGNTPERYAWQLKAAYKAIKEIDPDITITAAVTCSEHQEWLRRMLKAGAYDYFDEISIHPYSALPDCTYPDDGQGQAEANSQSFSDIIAEYGERKPVWISEMGWTSNALSNTDRNEQAACIARLFAITESSDIIDSLSFYDFRDDGQNEFEMEHHWGLVETMYSVVPNAAKESYAAVSCLNFMICNADFKEKSITDNIKLIKYSENGNPVNILWSLDGRKKVTLELSDNAEIYDMYGNKGNITSENGTTTLEINEDITYIKGADIKIMKVQKPDVIYYDNRYSISAVPALLEDGWYIKAVVKNHDYKLSGRLRIEMPELGICTGYTLFDLEKDEKFEISAKIQGEIDYKKLYRALIDINLRDGVREVRPELVSFLSIPFGKPEKTLISLDAKEQYFRIGGKEETPNLKADIALSYDEEKLYIKAFVEEDNHIQIGSAADNWQDIWDGDGIEFIIQPLYDGNKENMRFNDFGIALTSNTNEAVAWRWRMVSNRSHNRFRSCDLKVKREGKITSYYAEINWFDLLPPNVELKDCDSFGFAVRVNYAESTDRSIDGYLQLYGGVGGWRTPYSYQPFEFGRFILG